jgi:LPS-assembly protein
MNKSLFNKIVIFIFVLLSTFKAFAYEVDIAADNLEYDGLRSKLNAKGNVILYWEDKKLYADYIELLIDKKTLNACGNIKFEESGNTIYAGSITYNYDNESADIKETFSNFSSVFIRTNSMERLNKDTYLINDIKLSNCDSNNPHTYLKAKRGKLVMNKRVTLYFPFFYIEKIPIFFSPVVTKSLEGGRSFASEFKVTIEPGHTSAGISLKTRISCPLSENSTAEAIYDYLGAKGHGYGGNVKYSNKNKKGNIYIYTTKDLTEGKKRWALIPYYEQRINEWDIKSQGEFMSDENFDYSYNHQDNWNRVNNNLKSYASLTRHGQNTSLEIFTQRYDNYDIDKGNYKISSLTLPAVKLTYFPKTIFLGITHDFAFIYSRDYKQYTYKNISSLNYTLTKAFKLSRRLTLKPAFIITEDWCDRFITEYSGYLNSRYRATGWMDWNVKYSLTTKKERKYDIFTKDSGIGTNKVFFTNSMYIGNRITARNVISYNLCRNEQNNLKIWSPLVSEIVWTPKHCITAYITQSQFLNPFKCQSLNLDLKIGDIEKAYLKFGVFYQEYKDWRADNILGFGLWLTPKWRFDYNIRINSDYSKIRVNEQDMRLYRDGHCYNLGVRCRIIGKEYEGFFKFDIKTNMPFDKKKDNKNDNDDEKILYPWSDNPVII